MNTNRVLVVGNNSLLHAGLESLLLNKLRFGVVGYAPTEMAHLVSYIWHHLPDVIVMTSSSAIDPLALLKSLEGYPAVRIIEVDEEQNVMQIYDRQQAAVQSQTDLMVFVQSDRSVLPRWLSVC